MSWPVTLADRPLLMRKHWAREGEEHAVFDPTQSTTLVIAPCCGRHTPADTVVSLEGLVTEIRGGNCRPKADLDWGCDGCRNLLIADQSNGWTWSKLYRALGAPPEVIRHERAKELTREAERKSNTDDALLPSVNRTGFRPGEAYESALASLPVNVRELPGTERPDV